MGSNDQSACKLRVKRAKLDDLSLEDWDNLMALNFRPHMVTCKLASPMLVEGSSVINVGAQCCGSRGVYPSLSGLVRLWAACRQTTLPITTPFSGRRDHQTSPFGTCDCSTGRFFFVWSAIFLGGKKKSCFLFCFFLRPKRDQNCQPGSGVFCCCFFFWFFFNVVVGTTC